MNNLDELLRSLGIISPTNIQAIKADIESYAIELAISRLVQEETLSETDKENISKVRHAGTIDDAALSAIFTDQRRQEILQQSLSEAIATAIQAGNSSD